MMYNTSHEYFFFEFILKNSVSPKANPIHSLNQVIETYIHQQYIQIDKLIEYDVIYKVVSNHIESLEDSDLDYIENILINVQFNELVDYDRVTARNICNKIARHYRLAYSQLKAVQNSIKDIERKTRENIEEEIMKFQGIVTKSLNRTEKELLTHFVTVLGIFAAIIAVLFSSVQFGQSFISNNSEGKTDIFTKKEILIVYLIIAQFIITLFFMLMGWIEKITIYNKQLVEDKQSTKEKFPSYENIFIVSSVLITVFILTMIL